jgi:hypothetical protein
MSSAGAASKRTLLRNFQSDPLFARLRFGSGLLLRGDFSFDVAFAAFSFFDFVTLFSHNVFTFVVRFDFVAVTMITARSRFNIYLLWSLAVLACGCRTADSHDKKEKQVATIRVHLQMATGAPDLTMEAKIFRARPMSINIAKMPFLTEGNVTEAKVVEAPGGFMLEVHFDRQGSWLLEEYTTSNPGKHLAIFSQFGETPDENRWLAAPVISRRISNGTLVFTPDCSREEADQIARGLTNHVKQQKKKYQW